jgi:hypothetical protein
MVAGIRNSTEGDAGGGGLTFSCTKGSSLMDIICITGLRERVHCWGLIGMAYDVRWGD